MSLREKLQKCRYGGQSSRMRLTPPGYAYPVGRLMPGQHPRKVLVDRCLAGRHGDHSPGCCCPRRVCGRRRRGRRGPKVLGGDRTRVDASRLLLTGVGGVVGRLGRACRRRATSCGPRSPGNRTGIPPAPRPHLDCTHARTGRTPDRTSPGDPAPIP